MEKKTQILIADDSRADAELFTRAIGPFVGSKGLHVEYARYGEEALNLIKEKKYDLIFLDISMPGPTGLEILRYVKENHRKEKVVILTGYPDVDDHFCKMLGADEYLEKPVDPKALGAILDKYVPSLGPDIKN
ncbi:MAG: response regulator [Candidatus Omnitrophica bacterium]|nr:response regulator [Candidatus Omnitrophota bacterium]